jgi:hypothetical protein
MEQTSHTQESMDASAAAPVTVPEATALPIDELAQDARDWTRYGNGRSFKKFKGVHRTICRMHTQGIANNDIASYLGVDKCTVSVILNSGQGLACTAMLQQSLDGNLKDVSALLQETSLSSQKFLRSIATGDTEANLALRAKVAMDQLDRAGYGKINKNVNLDVQGSLTAEELDDIKRRAFSRGNIVEDSPESKTDNMLRERILSARQQSGSVKALSADTAEADADADADADDLNADSSVGDGAGVGGGQGWEGSSFKAGGGFAAGLASAEFGNGGDCLLGGDGCGGAEGDDLGQLNEALDLDDIDEFDGLEELLEEQSAATNAEDEELASELPDITNIINLLRST